MFAVVWVAAGARTLGRKWFAFLFLSAILISIGLIYTGTRIAPAHPITFNGKAYGIAVALEAILIVFAVVILRATNRKQLLLPIISVIVGLHFFGMVPALGSNLYWWIGGGMSLLSILTMAVLPQKAWAPTVGLGSALILWFAVVGAFFW